MPQITIEYSENAAERIDMQELMRVVHETTRASQLFSLGNGIRSRLAGWPVTRIGNGDADNAFIEIRLRIAHGRTDAERSALGAAIFEAAKTLAAPALEQTPFCVSVDIQQIDPVGAFTDNNLHRRNAPAAHD